MRIQYKRNAASSAPLGCISRWSDINVLSFDPGQNNLIASSGNDQNYFTPVTGMVHELGNV